MRPGAQHPIGPILVGLMALGASACGPGKAVVLDLALEAPLAEREWRYDTILFGTPPAERYVGRGLVREPRPPGGDPYAWARREAEVLLMWTEVRPRTLLLDVAPYPGVEGQTAEVLLNDVSLGSIEIPKRGRHSLLVPAQPQKAGENHLRLVFAKSARREDPQAPRMAAALFSLSVGPADDPASAALSAAAAPPPFSVVDQGGVRSLVQVSQSALRYALSVPEAAELRFTPSLRASAKAGERHRLRVTIRSKAGEQEVWSGTVEAGSRSGEVAVPLRVEPGQTIVLGLHVEGDGGGWGVWGAPRVMGRTAPDPAASTTAEAERRAQGLRRSLAGANVLLIILDAGGAKHFGCYGYPRATTPEIDRLAREGVLFERAFTPAVFTLGAMGSIWTSLPPDEHHRGVRYDAPLPRRPLTLAELLGAHGVTTAGWVANGMAGPAFGLDRGFSEFHEIYHERSFNADAFTKELPAWFRSHEAGRFFAYAHFREPHFPYAPPEPFASRFGPDRPLPADVRSDLGWIARVNSGRLKLSPAEADHLVRLYDGNLAFADHELGEIRKALETAGLWERTVVIVAADHGEGMLEHDFVGHNEQLYVESVHIPLVIRFPGGAGVAGVRVRALTDLLDVAPTIADIFGLLGQGGSDRAFSGRSLLPVLFGAPGKPAVFTRNAAGERPSYAIRDGRFALLRNSRYGQEELYDDLHDPGETRDLLGQEPLEAAYCRQRLFRWLAGLRRGEDDAAVEARLTPEQRENLRALGYIQ